MAIRMHVVGARGDARDAFLAAFAALAPHFEEWVAKVAGSGGRR